MMEHLIKRVDQELALHMEREGLELLHFTVRWFNCLLMRELPFHLVCRCEHAMRMQTQKPSALSLVLLIRPKTLLFQRSAVRRREMTEKS